MRSAEFSESSVYSSIRRAPTRSVRLGACWSPVGRSGDGEQKLSLGQRCWYLGIVIHELGHAVGFWHEMNRPDRDSYIYVYWDNIISVSDRTI
ncbi:unnamed protein product, partial [Timema podura]|nr:unnamed protein product [Timema podura]